MDRAVWIAVVFWWAATTFDWAIQFNWGSVKGVVESPTKTEKKLEKTDTDEIPKPSW